MDTEMFHSILPYKGLIQHSFVEDSNAIFCSILPYKGLILFRLLGLFRFFGLLHSSL